MPPLASESRRPRASNTATVRRGPSRPSRARGDPLAHAERRPLPICRCAAGALISVSRLVSTVGCCGHSVRIGVTDDFLGQPTR